VRCTLCPWQCVVEPGERGRCRVRENRDGNYVTLVHGRPCSLNNDPVEKKPFFHVLPGSKALSLATVGCNIECKFCQNWDISQADPYVVRPEYRSPSDIVKAAMSHGSELIAYTYSEPTVFIEFVLDCADESRGKGIGNVVVSNGFIGKDALRTLCRSVTAIKIDLKAFTESFYSNTCSARLGPVLDSLKTIRECGTWLEIVNLLIPGLNDSESEIRGMARWIVRELGSDVPVHFTRYHPAYKIRNIPPTPPATLAMARSAAADEGCRFAYAGNLPGQEGENTFCPSCKKLIIRRYGFMVLENRLVDGKCAGCKSAIPGVWRLPDGTAAG